MTTTERIEELRRTNPRFKTLGVNTKMNTTDLDAFNRLGDTLKEMDEIVILEKKNNSK